MNTEQMRPPSQTPLPGAHVLLYRGDAVEFVMTLHEPASGVAWLRTNIGNHRIHRTEIIHHVENNEPILARDWQDIQMNRIDGRHYSLKVPLLEVGCFDAKTFFLPDGATDPVWPEGGNTIIKVEPADSCCYNTIYCAFVRQFGPNRFSKPVAVEQERAVQTLEASGYHVIPQSGTFRELGRELDFIIGKMHFRIILLLPIHPVPSTFARMGRFGSPYAALNFKIVDSALAEFDRKTTPIDQFRELIDAVHARCAKLFMDIPINHTGWASNLHVEHPEWFVRDADKEFQSPGAWGVTWADLSKLDYSHLELWRYMADVFLHWCRQGVDGFRCDAGYMIPYAVWEYIAAKVRNEYPDTIFMLEGLGGSYEIMESLLVGANMDWSYSELFQNYDQGQIERYLPGCISTSSAKGTLVHFAETHDNDRLASKSHTYARLRTALTSLCSQTGAFGITNGVEWYADEKINVHGAPSLRWGDKDNQIDHITRLNAILETHPSFYAGAELHLIQHTGRNCVALVRKNPEKGSPLLILANLNTEHSTTITWSAHDFAHGHSDLYDLVSGKKVSIEKEHGNFSCRLEPGAVLCLTCDSRELEPVESAVRRAPAFPVKSEIQRFQAKAFDVWVLLSGHADSSKLDIQLEADKLRRDPREYCAALAQANELAVPITSWTWPRDAKRIVMVPPGHLLHVTAPARFSVEIMHHGKVLRREASLRQDNGSHFALLLPLEEPDAPRNMTLSMILYEADTPRHISARVMYLPACHNVRVFTRFTREQTVKRDCYALCTNGRGAMAQVRGTWGEIRSKYDALLAGNLHLSFPVDRHVMLTRCRAWLVYRGFSQEINRNCLVDFSVNEQKHVIWLFEVPSSMGKFVRLRFSLEMVPGRNTILLAFQRQKAGMDPDGLDDSDPVKLILRPDVEDRNCHETTRACAGPEFAWHNAVGTFPNGFVFSPSSAHRLRVSATGGAFSEEHQWSYMVGTPFDAERGLDQSTDLFSPGYFTLSLKGGDKAVLQADIVTGKDVEPHALHSHSKVCASDGKPLPLVEATRSAMRDFVVKRDDSYTVIAGYPWFLDWGRDTLICLRGMIAAGAKDEARDILRQFAGFESKGTLPNMIRGSDVSNRDTSDAPLWFSVACADLVRSGDRAFLNTDCGGRSIREVIHSIAASYMEGTPNGIAMDHDSGLIFSPPHFTWMDTNHPAATPRQGYPIEIQALWYAALTLLAEVEHNEHWRKLALHVRESVRKYYLPEGQGYLSDCLHASAGTPASKATPDDALRPNQLLAVTLGLVDDKVLCVSILRECEELLVPGAIRSLADRSVKYALPVRRHDALLNDPANPYWSSYSGDEDTRRKPAYHNGTAWTWIFPSYCEALFMAYGERSRETALALLSSSARVINQGCMGQVPEIVDGDAPHILRGCGAQAWGVTELHRVLAFLTRNS
jgi:starch synthase (maltosyl-transferring)